MKRFFLVAVFALIIMTVFALGSFAQDKDTSPDAMGLYFALESNAHCHDFVPFDIVTMYVVLANATFEELHGFEYGFSYDADTYFTNVSYICPSFVEQPMGDHFRGAIIGCGDPVPTTSFMVLASYSILPTAPISFFLQSADEADTFSTPFLAIGNYTVQAANVSGGIGNVSATIGDDCYVVNIEKQSWDSVKSLYR